MACRRRGQGEGGEERKPENDSAGNNRDAPPLRSAREPLPSEGKSSGREHCGHNGSAGPYEEWGHPFDSDPGEGHGEREGEDAEEAPGESGSR